MALYDCSKGLVFNVIDTSSPNGDVMKRYSVEYIRDKPYDVYSDNIYWVDDDKLYFKRPNENHIVIQNENLIGVRDILVLEEELITITHDYTIGVFDLIDNVFKEYGSPNPDLKLASLYNCKIIQPDQVFKLEDYDNDFSEYCGQNMILYTITEPKYKSYNPFNEYVNAKYKIKNMIDRNDKFVLYKKNNNLSMINYNDHDEIYDVPDDATLYNPKHDIKYVNVKSARSV